MNKIWSHLNPSSNETSTAPLSARSSMARSSALQQRVRDGIDALLFDQEKEHLVSASQLQHAVDSALAQPCSEASSYARAVSDSMLSFVNSVGCGEPSSASTSADHEHIDLAGSEREFVDQERVQSLLSQLLERSPGVGTPLTLRLSTKSFSRDAAETVARGITSGAGTDLVVADFSDVIAGRNAEEALETLQTLTGALAACSLSELNLSDNALGERGIRACAPAFQEQRSLQRLSLQNVGLSSQACTALKELLLYPEHLTSLRLYNNMSGNDGASAIASVIASTKGLQELRMASSRVGSDGGIDIANAIACASNTLTILDLSDNPLNEDAAKPLAAALSQHRNLKEVRLNECALDADGSKMVVQALAQSAPELEVLELGANDVGQDAAEWLIDSLSQMEQLRVLKLHENELSDSGVHAVLQGLMNSHAPLEVLDVSQNDMSDDGILHAVEMVTQLQAPLQEVQMAEHEVSKATAAQVDAILEHDGKEALARTLRAGLVIEDNDDE